MRVWARHEDVIHRSMELLNHLGSGYSTGKLLLKLPTIHGILQQHGPDNFPFLLEGCNARRRTVFYQTLTRLLFLDEAVVPDFDAFAAPLTRSFQVTNPLGKYPPCPLITIHLGVDLGFHSSRNVARGCKGKQPPYLLSFHNSHLFCCSPLCPVSFVMFAAF